MPWYPRQERDALDYLRTVHIPKGSTSGVAEAGAKWAESIGWPDLPESMRLGPR